MPACVSCVHRRTEVGLSLLKSRAMQRIWIISAEVLNQLPSFLGSPHPWFSQFSLPHLLPTPEHVPTSEPPLRSVIHWPEVQNFSGSRDVRRSKAFFRDPGIPSDCLRGGKRN